MKAGKETAMYNQGYMDGYNEGENAHIDPDYWTRLEHQYAGMAMQGILSNPQIWKDWNEEGLVTKDLEAADMADYFATALVEKLKSGSNEKTMHRLSTQS